MTYDRWWRRTASSSSVGGRPVLTRGPVRRSSPGPAAASTALWVNEYTIRYDDRPVMAVGILEFRDGKVVRERIYLGELWEPPAWRVQWLERMDPEAPPAPLCRANRC